MRDSGEEFPRLQIYNEDACQKYTAAFPRAAPALSAIKRILHISFVSFTYALNYRIKSRVNSTYFARGPDKKRVFS